MYTYRKTVLHLTKNNENGKNEILTNDVEKDVVLVSRGSSKSRLHGKKGKRNCTNEWSG